MDIVKTPSAGVLQVRVKGRLDNYWSESFSEALDEIVRDGSHHLRLEMADVNYLSSAAIGILVKYHQQVAKLQGTFVITAASDRVRTTLRMVGLEPILFGATAAESAPTTIASRQFESASADCELYELRAAAVSCRLVGDPAALYDGAFAASSSVAAGHNTFALGLGALGGTFDECRDMFGEFIAAGGVAASLPTDHSSTPDYMVSSGELIPQLQALYGIVFDGAPAKFLRFEKHRDSAAVPMSEIVAACASSAGNAPFGIVMAAETSQLVCAALRRSPATPDPQRFVFPSVRRWLSFTPGDGYERTSVLAVGIVTPDSGSMFGSFVRPVSDKLQGHLHAAVTAFCPLPRGRLDLHETTKTLFQPRSVVSVVHLLRDDRRISGVGESSFLRGACWLFPLATAGGAA